MHNHTTTIDFEVVVGVIGMRALSRVLSHFFQSSTTLSSSRSRWSFPH